jgi:ATP-dependent Clp endopeptidase proteolytic subunit ClpP
MTLPDPAELVLPIGDIPAEPGEELDKWIKLYRQQLELRQTAMSLEESRERRVQAATDRLRAELDLEQSRLAVAKTRLELAELERTNAETRAAAKHARVCFFSRPVTKKSVAETIDTLGLWSRRDPEAEMRLVINTPGGDVLHGLALYDFLGELKALGHHLTTVAIGSAASFGAVLLQAGDRRLIGRNASVMLHELSVGTWGKLTTIEDDIAFGKSLQHRLLSILASRSALSVEEITARWSRKDWWLTAEEVVELGLADELSA